MSKARDIADLDIGVTVQAYDVDTAKYDDVTANFTSTLQNGGSNVVVDSDIGSTVQVYNANTVIADSTQTLTNKTISGADNTFTVDGTNEVGFRTTPVNEQSANYTLALADSGKTIYHPASDANARTFTIPANASVAYAIGTVVTFANFSANNVIIAITTDTLRLAGDGSTGSRTLAQYGVASAIKLDATTWLISGNGLT